MEERGDFETKPGANDMSLQPNDAAAELPSRDDSPPIPPNPFAGSPPRPSTSSRQSRAFIDLSSPTKPNKRMRPQEEPSAAVRPPPSRKRPSGDELRLVGDFSRPADAVNVPDPRSWLPKSSSKKPGARSRFQPTNTLTDGGSTATRSKPTTYSSKEHCPRSSLIGLSPHGGQQAYLEQHRGQPPSHISASRAEYGRSTGATPGKRRKTEPVVDLVEDDDDEVMEVSPSVLSAPAGTFYDIPLSARSSQSRMSVGSGSTMTGNKPSQPKSEFREADGFLRSSQRKPRKSGSNRPQGARRHSPFAGGEMAEALIVLNKHNPGRTTSTRQTILQDFQQGGSDRSRKEHHHHSAADGYTASHHFPNARINESTAAQTVRDRRLAGEGMELRKLHRPAPKEADMAVDSNSEDELAPSPVDKKKQATSKAARAANSGVKRKVTQKSGGIGWPLVFARSHDYERRESTFDANKPDLQLRFGHDAWHVKMVDTEGNLETQFKIHSAHVIKASADDIGRIRFEGPRRTDGNIHIFDLEFARTSDFLNFRKEFLTSTLLINGKLYNKEEKNMLVLFGKPLPEQNTKVGKSELVNEPIMGSEHQKVWNDGVSKTPLLDGLKQPPTGSTSRANTATVASTRPPRHTRSAPTYDIDDSADRQKVFKYSIVVGLGPAWTKPLEYGQGRQRAIVHFDDLPRLDEDECLNDSLIDFYMIYLSKKLDVPADKVYFFNSFFFSRLIENSGRKSMDYKAVERWTAKIDVFSYDYVVIPINEQYHWYLAIICNVNKIKRKPVFENFDEGLSQTHNRSGEGSVTLAAETEDMTGPQPTSPPKPSTGTQDTPNGHPDDDVNLFDAESLSLVNPEDTGAEVQHEPGTNQANSVPQSPQAEPTEVAQATANAKSMPASILSQTTALPVKSKVRRKPAQAKRDPSQPVILILDSLPGVARSGTVRALKDWIEAEGDAKRGMEVKIKENGYYPKASQIPMQSNYTDCGVYLLGYVEKFFQNPDEFKNKLLTGSMSAEEDWPELKPEDMRQKMREIIVELHEQQELERQSKKVKKGVTQSMTLPAPPPQGLTKSEIKAPVTERLPTKETRTKNPKGQPKHTPHNADEYTVPQSESHVRPTQPRLALPFEYDHKHEGPPEDSVSEAVDKVSDSPPGATSPIKSASVTPRPDRTPGRSGPQVRIPVKTPQSNTSARNRQPMLAETAQHQGELRRTGHAPRSLSPTKRRRPHADDAGLPAAKKQSPRQRSRDRNMASSPLNSRSRGGSAPSQPIEIEDSQEANPTVSRPFQQPQADSRAQRKPPSRWGQPTLRHSPSFQEIERPSPKKKHRRSNETFPGHALEDKLDEQDAERNQSRRSKTSAPPSSLNRTEEADPDSTEEISQSTGRMQLDGADDDAVVRETPEPGRRSPDAQARWSKNHSLPL